MHICVSKLTIIGSDNGLSHGRHQAIIWTNAGILLIGTFGTNFSEILIRIQTFSFTKMHLKMSSAKWRPFCLGFNVFRAIHICSFNSSWIRFCCHNYSEIWTRVSSWLLKAPRDCLLNRLFRRGSKKTSKVRITGLCVGNSPVIGEFPAQMASNAENVSIYWRHHALKDTS